jgi:Holliday junction resolvase-like predicted endonuclease
LTRKIDHLPNKAKSSASPIGRKTQPISEFKVRWFLWFKDYRLIARRWRWAAGQIDQILSRRQQQRITKAALLFLAKNSTFTTFDYQFDFIIMQAGQNFEIGKIAYTHNAW